MLTLILLTGLIPAGTKRAAAVVIGCDFVESDRKLVNRAIADYEQPDDSNNKRDIVTNSLTVNLSNSQSQVEVINQGIEDEAGNIVSTLGAIANSLNELFIQRGLDEVSAKTASVSAISQWASLSADSDSAAVAAGIKQSLVQQLPEQAEAIEQIPDGELLTVLAGLRSSNIQALNLTPQEVEAINQAEIAPQTEGSLIEQIQNQTQTIAQNISNPEAKAKFSEIQTQSLQELENIRQGKQDILVPGTQLRFKFRLENQSQQSASLQLPTVQAITEQGLIGAGEVKEVLYGLTTAEPAERQPVTDDSPAVSIPKGESLDLEVQVEVGTVAENTFSTIGIDLQSGCGSSVPVQTVGLLPLITPDGSSNPLIDPRGEISGCAGELLPDYRGFSVGLYDLDASDPTQSEAGGITPLTTTELPDDPNNDVPAGIEPNIENSNPFFLTNSDDGQYSFLFDEEAGQLDKGRNYILVVDPGADSVYDQRRIKLTIGDRQGNVVQYTATSLDGRPITIVDGQTTVTGEIVLVEDAERVGLNLAVLDLSTNICDAQEIAITKTGDRAAAEPGDIVLYRLALRNLASVPLTSFQVSDTLPRGFRFESDSVRAELGSQPVEIETTQNGSVVSFSSNATVPSGEVINLVYAAQVTPDALRGSGENSAIVNAQRTDNNFNVKAGPAIHNLELEPGIVQDSGVLLGRVFVDKNFDGEQQSGEPGVPNAVIYLEDGNRIITDAEGLFSVSNVLPGYHTGTLDFTSIPEYRLAPNLRFSERNSKSRLVNLEPGGMVRMNFGVTPTAAGKDTPSKPTPAPPAETPATNPSN